LPGQPLDLVCHVTKEKGNRKMPSQFELEYVSKTPGSRVLWPRAQEVFPSGVTHDSRIFEPYPLCIDRAAGSHKWDVDGNEYIDYYGGHGALLLGHCHPAVVEAVTEQASKGTQFGSSNEMELRWAEQIVKMVPCAEKVRFTSSGTEASHLAFRISRAASGKPKVLRFASHFHGWHDQVAWAATTHLDGSVPAGITGETMKNVVVCPPNDVETLERYLATNDDIAAAILEPTGGTFGAVPTSGEYLQQLRKLTEKYGVLLIFDEVVTGFRVAPGGAQEHYGVIPDLTLLAKIMAGGYPGGAVVGHSDVMEVMNTNPDPEWTRQNRVSHYGTFNANPFSASAGLATLELIAAEDMTGRANAAAQQLRETLTEIIQSAGLNWVVYGEFSGVHIFTNGDDMDISVEDIYCGRIDYRDLKRRPQEITAGLRHGLLARGVDFAGWPGAIVSAVHSSDDLDRTASVFAEVAHMFKEELVAG
jgi:glutamate-1-semialdehyde 2,1-aminomutase